MKFISLTGIKEIDDNRSQFSQGTWDEIIFVQNTKNHEIFVKYMKDSHGIDLMKKVKIEVEERLDWEEKSVEKWVKDNPEQQVFKPEPKKITKKNEKNN